MDTKKIMGIVTISLIVGGSIYAITKYKKGQTSEAPLTVDEARGLVELSRLKAQESTAAVAEALGMSSEEINELQDEARDEAGWNASFAQPEYDFYDGLEYNRPLSEYIKEEDKVLRFQPNTLQARDHFIKMELAELMPSTPEYQIMKRLFDFHFEPLCDGDDVLYSQLADHRAEFFGPDSKWNDNVSMADIITHYARLADFDLNGGVGMWINTFVHNTHFYELAASVNFDKIIEQLNQHVYTHPETGLRGIFGLTEETFLFAIDMADNTIDGEVTYEIEYNMFLKTKM